MSPSSCAVQDEHLSKRVRHLSDGLHDTERSTAHHLAVLRCSVCLRNPSQTQRPGKLCVT